MTVFRIQIHKIRKFLGLPDPLVKGVDPEPDPSNIKQNSKKTLIYTVLWLLYDVASLKNDVSVPLKEKSKLGVLKVADEKSRIRIR